MRVTSRLVAKITSRLVVIHDIEIAPGLVVQEVDILASLVTDGSNSQDGCGSGHPAAAQEVPHDPRCKCNFNDSRFYPCPVHRNFDGARPKYLGELFSRDNEALMKRFKDFLDGVS